MSQCVTMLAMYFLAYTSIKFIWRISRKSCSVFVARSFSVVWSSNLEGTSSRSKAPPKRCLFSIPPPSQGCYFPLGLGRERLWVGILKGRYINFDWLIVALIMHDGYKSIPHRLNTLPKDMLYVRDIPWWYGIDLAFVCSWVFVVYLALISNICIALKRRAF